MKLSGALALALCACACTAGSASEPSPPPVLCSGGDEIVFHGMQPQGTHRRGLGRELLGRNGQGHVFLTSSCTYYCTTDRGVSRSVQLDEAGAQELLRPFELHRFAEHVGAAAIADCFRPEGRFGVGAASAHLEPSCAGSADEEWFATLKEAMGQAFRDCETVAEPVDGAVWYALLREAPEEGGTPGFEKGTPWPLAIDPNDVAVPIERTGIVEAPRMRVDGADAALLRDLLRRHLRGEFSSQNYTTQWIPIRQADGQIFTLWVSDVLPGEDEHGVLPFALP